MIKSYIENRQVASNYSSEQAENRIASTKLKKKNYAIKLFSCLDTHKMVNIITSTIQNYSESAMFIYRKIWYVFFKSIYSPDKLCRLKNGTINKVYILLFVVLFIIDENFQKFSFCDPSSRTEVYLEKAYSISLSTIYKM